MDDIRLLTKSLDEKIANGSVVSELDAARYLFTQTKDSFTIDCVLKASFGLSLMKCKKTRELALGKKEH